MTAPSTGIALRFEDVTVSFAGIPAISDISFEVQAGETRIVFGAAGSGKSVVLKTALGLIKPESGRVYLFGQNIADMSEEELFDARCKVGMLFQEGALFDSLTIAENVAYPLLNQKAIRTSPEEADRRVREALRFVELEATLDKFPAELSGGMRRRAAIARAVVTEPPVLLYDSPTAGLDPITANTIITLIVKQRDLSQTTTLIVTHRYKNGYLLAKYRYDSQTGQLERERRMNGRGSNTKFLGLKDGKLIFEGRLEELEASTDPYVSKFVKHNG